VSVIHTFAVMSPGCIAEPFGRRIMVAVRPLTAMVAAPVFVFFARKLTCWPSERLEG
jgi:hypothetical protein